MKYSNRFILFLAVLFVAVMTGFYCYAGQDLERLDPWAFESPRRPGAVFSHDDHIFLADDDCSVCHHVYEDGELVSDESSDDLYCSDCHSLKPAPDNPMPLEAAYHNLCRDCHFDRGEGPVLCGECHVKE
ncbi:MAG: cytochrome c family protein [Desulfotignum sp.]|nr:cytochrome c family protein [Desulfotignum sp.]MCF8087350.1 cytochrome c family protein [Desulfotignum sp.]MCF8135708.1 cytochrome c family protein [Desulfotignum sp.]